MAYVKRFEELFKREKNPDAILAHHGSKSQINEFDDKYVGKGSDQEGPGIYFTSDENDARMQGGPYVTTVSLSLKKTVPTQGNTKAKRDEILFLINNAPDKDDTLTNWSENPREAMFKAVDSIMKGKNAHDMFQNVWYEFYRKTPTEYVKNMSKLGYDGVIIDKKDGIKHYVVFNKYAIKILR